MYSVDSVAGWDTLMLEKHMVAFLVRKWQHPYAQMVPYVQLHMIMALA